MANLKVKVEKLDPIKKRVTVEVPHEEFQKKMDEAYDKLSKTTSIAGFRQGKVPREVLMQKFEGRILSEAAQRFDRRDLSRGAEAGEDHAAGPSRLYGK